MSENYIQGVALENGEVGFIDYDYLANKPQVSVKDFGAKGDGKTDDTQAFRDALGNSMVEITLTDGSKGTALKGDGKQHCVYVYGGKYKLSDTVVIPENCCLVLSQDTILQFTQTSGNCIEMRGSAVLDGHHGNIDVSQSFKGNVISVDTGLDGVIHASIPPYIKGTPMWKRQRFIKDINITKTHSTGFQAVYSSLSEISGTALYISANYETKEKHDGSNSAPISFIWGMVVSGLRIAGAFQYGINIQNKDKSSSGHENSQDPAWNHDMRIEAVIVSCETGVRVFNCNTAHLAVTIQPAASIGGAVYAKNGIILEHSENIDLSSSIVWDWNADNSLIGQDKKNAHIALYGDCKGLILSDHMYNKKSDSLIDVRQLIYTDTPKNLKTMSIVQESVIRWFSPSVQEIKDESGTVIATKIVPTFSALENQEVGLLTEDDMSRFISDRSQVANFEYFAKDKILLNTRLIGGTGNVSTSDPGYDYYYFTIDYIPFDITRPLFLEEFYISKTSAEASSSLISFYDSSKNPIMSGSYTLIQKFDWGLGINAPENWNLNWKFQDISNKSRKVTEISVPESLQTNTTWRKIAYVRICSANSVNPVPESVIISSTPIQYSEIGKLADGIMVETNQILNFTQTVNNLIAAQLMEVENGSY